MNHRLISVIVTAATAFSLYSCSSKRDAWVTNAIEASSAQLKETAALLKGTETFPRSIWSAWDLDFLVAQIGPSVLAKVDSLRQNPPAEKLGTLRTCGVYDWTSGFFPGSLWLAYELTGDEQLRDEAAEFTNELLPVSYYKGTHDLGFMIGCSYGNAERLSPADSIPPIIVRTADNLASRFDSRIGAIRSWDFGVWNFPVIIDNMMNLELLFEASKISGDSKYRDIALKHADKTMANHFRPDYTSWHVVSYNADGTVETRQTFQGKADDSAWARGQAWGVYGYTVCYRETKDDKYLEFAENIADMIMSRVTTEDAVPYWDYDAPEGADTPRDASAAAVTASAFLELGGYAEDGQKYLDYAGKILRSLSSKEYLAEPGTNCGFILKHSTGSLAHGSEIDVPLNYADYYYLEALKRYIELNKKK